MPRRAPFEIAGASIAPGTRQTVRIPVSVLADHTPVSLSAHVIHGQLPGPTVFVSAGIHGDEVIGVEIVRRLLGVDTLDRLKGTLIAVPLVNMYGLLNRSRYLPDRRDLNRSFPGHERGSLASRLAHLFMTEVVERCDLGIDLHSAAIYRSNLPQIRISADNRETLRLARVFGAPIVMQSTLREGSLRGAAKDIGVDVLLFEAGEALRFDEFCVRVGVMGVLRVLNDQGMLPKKGISRAKSRPLFSLASRWVRAPQGGLLRVYKSEGEMVEQDDVLAYVSDPFGEHEEAVTAPFAGMIVGRAVMPVVNEGDALFHIAEVGASEDAEDMMDALTEQLDASTLFDEDEII